MRDPLQSWRGATATMPDPLPTWREGAAKQAVLDFVREANGNGGGGIPVAQRLAVFDNDGTLWAEKPMPIQLDFILRRLAAMAEADLELRERQPWKAAYERDYEWLATVLAEHYAGNDANVATLVGGVLAAHANISVD